MEYKSKRSGLLHAEYMPGDDDNSHIVVHKLHHIELLLTSEELVILLLHQQPLVILLSEVNRREACTSGPFGHTTRADAYCKLPSVHGVLANREAHLCQ